LQRRVHGLEAGVVGDLARVDVRDDLDAGAGGLDAFENAAVPLLQYLDVVEVEVENLGLAVEVLLDPLGRGQALGVADLVLVGDDLIGAGRGD